MSASALRALASVCHVVEGDACRSYTVQGMVPRAVARPDGVEAVAAVLRIASERRLAVTAWGGGTHQGLGYVPQRLDLALSLERLNHVFDYEPSDLTISVQAGMTGAAVARTLASAEQILPIDVPVPALSTVGGAIAAGVDGPRANRYGLVRDLLIGARVVQSDGTVWKSGGLVVKNVSGYDLHKLLVASLGSLGVVVEANFKVLPRPQLDRTLLVRHLAPGQAADLVAKIRRSPLEPSSVTLMGGPGLGWLRSDGGATGWADLAVRCEGRRERVERHVRDIRDYAQEVGADDLEDVDEGRAAELWDRVTRLSHGIPEGDAAPHAALRLRGNRSGLCPAIEELEHQAIRGHLICSWVADAATGVLVAHLHPEQEDDAWTAEVASVSKRLATWTRGATLLGVRPVPPLRVEAWGLSPPGLAIMRRIKAAFDPHDTLNPGRCAGRL